MTVKDGDNQSFTITPAANYHVADVVVDGSSVGTVTSYTFNKVTADHSIIVTFAIADQGEPNGKPDLTISSLTTPSTGGAGLGVAVSVTTKNNGPGNAPTSTTDLYLSIDSQLGGGDTLLGSISVPALAAGADSTDTIDVTIPESAASGDYYLIAKADAPGAITETKETNNIRSRRIRSRLRPYDIIVDHPIDWWSGFRCCRKCYYEEQWPGQCPYLNHRPVLVYRLSTWGRRYPAWQHLGTSPCCRS